MANPFLYDVYGGTTTDSFETIVFSSQAARLEITVENDPIAVKVAYGNQPAYYAELFFEGSFWLPVGTYTLPAVGRGIAVKSLNSSSPGTYQIIAWFKPSIHRTSL